ncbi:DMT family transporter [Mesorhizobium sp. YC-39]|uniref:DMT family transporter n=1 Tax=unclassified Mesorhizobium TaxID=325217 RepID=UPI0021E6F105|nr:MULTISPECIES: DMT family transporter [unclassified Mesorhizobium]MCV3211637.1 DMT family transporter [Mesorhizobium sp. YC-2]MCV3233314.1 DMT family transporter [Mesorhizobium sp. YC-39]
MCPETPWGSGGILAHRKRCLFSGLSRLWYFLLPSRLMLAVSYAWSGAPMPSANTFATLLALGILPSICGFYGTIRAVQHIEAYKTQVIESSELFFSALFAAVFFGEWLTGTGMLAALAIIVGALITSMPERRVISMQVRPIAERE